MSTLRVVGISGGLNKPSRTTFLVNAVLREIEAHASQDVAIELIEVVNASALFGQYVQREQLPAAGEALLSRIEHADIIVAGSPVYKGAYTGLFKHLFDFLDPNSLVDTPVVLAATGGSDRHTLMTDHTLRPLFSFFRSHTVPTSLYATSSQVDAEAIHDAVLRERVEVAARQALHLVGAPPHRLKPVKRPLATLEAGQ